MNIRRGALGTAGVLLLGLSVAVSDGGVLADLVGAAVTALGNDYLLLAAIAAGGLVLAGAMIASGRAGNLDQARMPDPERPIAVPAPGGRFDERVGGLRFGLPVVGRSAREAVRERLRATAVDVTMRAQGCGRAEAERRVAEGRWTDDPEAAAFLAEGSELPSAGGTVAALLDGETPQGRRARRTADALVDRASNGGRDR